MLLRTIAVLTALIVSAQASSSSSSSGDDCTAFEELNRAIQHYQEAVDEKGNFLHEQPAKLSLGWDSYSPLSALVPKSLSHVVDLTLGSFLTEIPPEIASLKNLRSFSLSITTWEALPESLGTMSHLTYLSIAHAKTGRIPAFLQNLPGLKNLSFHCSIMNFATLQGGHDFFAAFTHLTSLHLGNRGENCAVIPRSIAHLENLKSLDIENLKIFGRPSHLQVPGFELERGYSFAGIANFKALQAFLKIQGADYGMTEWAAFQEEWKKRDDSKRKGEQKTEPLPLGNATNLKNITLKIDHAVLPKALYRFRSLTHLEVGSFVTEIPEGIAALTHLESLHLSTSDGSILPTDLGDFPSLRTLHISHMNKGDYLRHTGLTRLTQLEELNLHCSHTNGDLTPLSAFTKLEKLHLGDKTEADLTPLLALTQLKKLHLGKTGKNVPKVIGQLTSLQSLHLGSAKLPGFEMTYSWQSCFYGDELQRALTYIRNDAYDLDAIAGSDSDDGSDTDDEDDSYEGKGKGSTQSKEEEKKSPASSSSNKIFLTEETQEILPRLFVTLEETETVKSVPDSQTLEAIRYALVALNAITLNHGQTAGIDLAHHLKMCETLVKLTQHFKKAD